MNQNWLSLVDFLWIAFFFVLATMIKSRIRFFKNFIIPTSILAGFIGLLLGPEVLQLVSFNIERIGNLVYHAMAIGFIALSLKEREKKKNKEYTTSGIFIVSGYLVQGIVGFSISLILAYTIYPNLFPPMGLLLPLGFGQGPGQAYSIGTQWQRLGLSYGGNLGLMVATIGFLWATIVGVVILNYLIKKGKLKNLQGESIERVTIKEEMSPDEIPLSDAHDKLTFQISVIGIIYLITYITISMISNLLVPLGTFGQTFAQLLWGFHFIIGSIYALLFRTIFDKLAEKGFVTYNKPNNYLLQRVAGSSFDFMITASIAAISFFAFKSYFVPLFLITTIGGIVTIYVTLYLANWIYPNDKLENFLGFYGMLTGTISTGMALLRAVDPKFKTNVSDNIVMGSAVALAFGFPLLIILNVPIVGYVTNQPIMYFYTLLLFIGYLGILLSLLYFLVKKKRAKYSFNRTIANKLDA